MMRPPPVDEDAPVDAFGAPPMGPTEEPGGDFLEEDEEGGEPDMEAMLAELGDAEAAGEQYAADAMFAPVPGAEAEVEAKAELTPEQLQELLLALKQP